MTPNHRLSALRMVRHLVHTLAAATQPEASPHPETSMDCIGCQVGRGVPGLSSGGASGSEDRAVESGRRTINRPKRPVLGEDQGGRSRLDKAGVFNYP